MSIRLRLTLVYGGLFLLSGAALLGVTYLLVENATQGFIFQGENGGVAVIDGSGGASPSGQNPPKSHGKPQLNVNGEVPRGADKLTPRQAQAQAEALQRQAGDQHDRQLEQLLVQSAIALGIMAIASIGLGWIVAGRVLRPIRTITASARQISATNLHSRLAIDGPDDDLKELSDTFDDLLGRLESSFEAQRQFVANASHELRTPLARQRTMLELSLSDPEPTVESLRATDARVLAAGRQQEILIDGLLALARSERGLERRETFDLADIAVEVVSARRPEADRRSLRFETTLRPATAAGDLRLVSRLVANLVDNAIKHNVDGGEIHLTTITGAARATIAVENDGPPIAPDQVGRLMAPFERLDSTRVSIADGLGLGLSIVHAVAVAHDARLDVRARPDGGLAVVVSFPAPFTAPPGSPPREDGASSAPTPSSAPSRWIRRRAVP